MIKSNRTYLAQFKTRTANFVIKQDHIREASVGTGASTTINAILRFQQVLFTSIFALLVGCSYTGPQSTIHSEKETKHILLLSGKKTHGHGQHENNSGISVLENLLQRQTKANFVTKIFLDAAWPTQSELDNADAIVIMSDGDQNHLLKDKMAEFDSLLEKNSDLGLLFIHYATVPEGRKSPDFKGTYFNNWIGGFYAGNSKNRTLTRWTHIQSKLSEHPVNKGVEPYTIFDEIYYRMEYVDSIKPIVVAETFNQVPTFYSNTGKSKYERDRNQVASFLSELERTIFWSFDRKGGGKSIGTTMGHTHSNFWMTKSIRKQLVNSVAWISGMDIPEEGFDALDLTEDQMMLNHSLPNKHK
ncbi:ThuA domain-containing protein [Paraglaciecola sp. L3A3]|uniref:ThuA domain-containing protein n=1 Tax=Paraglaciecola sp. L3A3 TaxID=2686358 RepID=UPI00131E562B|nr:ThuA domain-containing protein [Paraglaciecola sp. L3A3]